ncbi:MAG: helix-turn-helix domain-containing protein [Dehalococcoidia bacterium]
MTSAPDLVTRIAILRTKAEEQHAIVPDAVLQMIAGRFTKAHPGFSRGRSRAFLAYSRLTGEPSGLTPSSLRLRRCSRMSLDCHPPELVIEVVCRYFALDRDALLSKSRDSAWRGLRQLAMYLMREPGTSLPDGDWRGLGGRDHSTVHHGWRKMERSLAIDPETKRDVSSLREMIEQSCRVA